MAHQLRHMVNAHAVPMIRSDIDHEIQNNLNAGTPIEFRVVFVSGIPRLVEISVLIMTQR